MLLTALLSFENNFLGIKIGDLSVLRSDNNASRVEDNAAFDARRNEWRFWNKTRSRLLLHVRTHERSVGVVVVQEWNEGCCDREGLVCRDIYIVNLVLLCK